uniref:Mitochondrial carrier homolog 2 n=1 Tax=Sus scrofa TaxID=9823 RepID=A0A8D0V6N3_PIG
MADAASQVLLGSSLTILSQPLIQVGYESLPPTIGRNIFGGKYVSFLASFVMLSTLPASMGRSVDFIKETTREMMARSAATLITHPFHVITLRSMVQFIGRESKYCGLCDSMVTIYREEGILGYFAGLIPRLLGDIISLWLFNSLAYLISTYALDSGVSTMNEISYSQAVTGFFASMLMYPFVLVSHLMAVNNCGLADCWCMLQKEGNMSKGNSLFFWKVPFGKTYCCDLRMLI